MRNDGGADVTKLIVNFHNISKEPKNHNWTVEKEYLKLYKILVPSLRK